MPFVTIKAAMSLDGKIATRTGESKWITGENSRALVQELRRGADAVMVGGRNRCRRQSATDPFATGPLISSRGVWSWTVMAGLRWMRACSRMRTGCERLSLPTSAPRNCGASSLPNAV